MQRLKEQLPNIVTLAALSCGVVAIMLAPVDIYSSVVLLMVASVLDNIDGKLARLVGTAGRPFGQALDSLCDMISFGTAPAAIFFHAPNDVFNPLGETAWLAGFALLFPLGGAIRLARFQTDTDDSEEAFKTFRGLPIPAAALLVTTPYMAAGEAIPAALKELLTDGRFLTVQWALVAALMVSRLRLPSFKGLSKPLAALLLGTMLGGFVLLAAGGPGAMVLWTVLWLYLLYGLLETGRKRLQRR